MSYSIIFQTKIVDLGDGRIIHFNRSGCNNDNEGREKNVFHALVYSKEQFIDNAKKYMEGSKPYKDGGDFELKIGSRYASCYDYGMHLLRMLKRAENIEQFKNNNHFRAAELVNIEVTEPITMVFSPKEFSSLFYDILYRTGKFAGIPGGGIKYRRNMKYHYDLSEVIPLIEKSAPVEYFISKR